MTPEQKAAFINAAAARLNATIAGMTAENQHRMNSGAALAYTEIDFVDVVNAEVDVSHNRIVEFFRD